MVPKAGLEPARISPHAPQTCASTNSATWAIERTASFAFAWDGAPGAPYFEAGAAGRPVMIEPRGCACMMASEIEVRTKSTKNAVVSL